MLDLMQIENFLDGKARSCYTSNAYYFLQNFSEGQSTINHGKSRDKTRY